MYSIMKGGENISNEPKRSTLKLLHALLDGISDMTKTAEYRSYRKISDYFIYPDEVMAQIKAHNPNFTKATTVEIWDKPFKRYARTGVKPFSVSTTTNPKLFLLDISQTKGKELSSIYQNVSGKVEHYQQILDCLVNYSDRPILFQEGAAYYSGIGQDSFIENGKIVIRSALSEQQIIFALVRELIRQHQASTIVVEAASYMVCRHLGIDTSDFTFGYLLEYLKFDERLKALKDPLTHDTIMKEAEVLIGYLSAHLHFTQSSSGDEAVLEIAEKQEITDEPEVMPSPDKPIKQADDRIETIHGIEFRFIKIIKEFLTIHPDKSITQEMVKDYSYFDTNMLFLGNAVAVHLFKKGKEIYILHKDNTEVRAESLDDISKHYGLFGITKDDWLTMQMEMAKNSLSSERVKINRWGQIATKEIAPKKGGRRISENTERSTGNTDIVDPTEMPELGANGSICVIDDDISHNDVENHEWIQPALAQLFDKKRYKQKEVPFFIKQGDFEPSPEMKKINEVMTLYAAATIPKVLKSCVVQLSNGKKECNTYKAVKMMCGNFNTQHIALALEVHWQKIKAPIGTKAKFSDYFHKLKTKLDAQIKKPTPDESMRRVKAKSYDAATAQAEQNKLSNQELELIHIMDSYKNKFPAKPKEAPKVEPIIPSLSTIKTKAR